MHNTRLYRLSLTLTIVTSLVMIWLSLGVGIIGADGDPANRLYFVVLGIGIVGAAIARLRALAMVRVLLAMAAALAAITIIAIVNGLGQPWSGPTELILLNGFFIAAFASCAWMFNRSTRSSSRAARSSQSDAS